MANKTPFGNTGSSQNLLPGIYQTPANKKFLQSTIDQLFQSGTVSKINGYIGRRNSKATVGTDIFINAAEANRRRYQLEPGVVIKDDLGNVTFFKDYIDYINQLNVFGGNTDNHARLNKQEFYSWDPHINWDKFVNFQNYYWLPYGPESITIYGQQLKIESTYTINLVPVGENNEYIFTPNGFTPNPVLKLYKGQTYKFDITSPGNPLSFKLSRSLGKIDRYLISGIDNHAVESGSITFTVPTDAPTIIYYQSETDLNLGGEIQIHAIDDNTYIDIEKDLLGKKTYKLSDGTAISNGMKVNFGGNVTPASYAVGQYYVEGVGSAIKLVPESTLEIVGPYTISEAVLFDDTPFDQKPFGDATGYAGDKDYIVVNRASRDHNPWSRYNRWFHKDVVTTSSNYNNSISGLDQLARATRPIIEFNADLKLFNFGTTATIDVNLIDDFTLDVFSTIEGSAGYNIDGIDVTAGHLILVNADTDPLVKNKIYRVEFIDVKHVNGGTNNQIHLVEVASPEFNQVVLVKDGKKNQSLMYWFNGTTWLAGQQKTTTNQAPLFDVVDNNNISYGDATVYNGTTFKGTKLFSYKQGSSVADSVLGFPLSYKNVSNIGDIVFNFDLVTDSFEYKTSTTVISQKIDVGYLISHDYAGNISYVNGWQTCLTETLQAGTRIYKNSNKTNNFNIDIFDDVENLKDLIVKIYVNGNRLSSTEWSIVDNVPYKLLVLKSPIQLTDVLTIKTFAAQPINNRGFYEIPVNLQNNPLNNTMGDFTLGEVLDHVNSIVDNVSGFSGKFPGVSNLRDLGNVTPYGTKFVQHSGPASLSIYHITSQTNNIVRAIEQARDDYSVFKRVFIDTATNIGVDGAAPAIVDMILEKINKDKPNSAPYYFSDMVPYGASLRTDLTVVDYRIKTYPLSTVFTTNTLSNKAVCVYLNGVQLLHGTGYTFSNQGFVIISSSVEMSDGDVITTYEYDSTDGSFVPETPTKLGIWPKYEPKIYLDTTLVTPQMMIQCHDGSLILAYNDYRDDLILELEKRIFNNIKVEYDPSIYDINDVIPGYNRPNQYSLSEFNSVLAPNFYKWTRQVGTDVNKNLIFNIQNSFTYNYSRNSAPDGSSIPGFWRGVYRWLLDTDRPNICPWEMLGFTIEPDWWTSLYGPAPYTSDNRVMWQDIADGIVRAPGTPPVKLSKYAKPFLMNKIPVDQSGNLISPVASGLAGGTTTNTSGFNFIFGDGGPVESAWRRSSHYPFSVLLSSILLTPAKTFGILLDRSRIVRNLAGQLIYKDTGLRIRPQDIALPSIYSSTTRLQTAGIINYAVSFILNSIFSSNSKSYKTYASDLSLMTLQLGYRVGAFTNKDQFNLLLDSKTPSSSGSVFIPTEDYTIFLNSSSPVKKLTYSGIMITKLQENKFQVTGYSQTQPYFKYYSPLQSGQAINVGGISENFSIWASNQPYSLGAVVKYGNVYYRTTIQHTSQDSFETKYFTALTDLPIVGGQTALFRKSWDKSTINTAPYGQDFTKVQDVVDFILGYGEWLKDQGFDFNKFNTNLGVVSNWETSAKEFMFWTTQNWSTGQDKWENWSPYRPVPYGSIVRYNGDYYSALKTMPATSVFDYDNFNKLEGLNIDGASVISLSPAAGTLSFTVPLAVADDLTNQFNDYEIVKANGSIIQPSYIKSYRKNNATECSPRTTDGIYGASFYFIQHEHVVIINNNTIFNDVIYNPESGYRQERIKVSGYVTNNWYGGLDIPGFIYDSAKIENWQAWKDYNMGDVVNYQGYYYSATAFTAGTTTFVSADWTRLAKKPVAQILPNWTNIATQFTDFYSLDVDSFDVQQQKMAHHLVGYQKRQYLDNIIQDDVSEFKFYQGMIREKGTQNVLNKLFDVLSSENKESLAFYEEWAIRTGMYGASTAFEQIEFIIDEKNIRSNPQGYDLVNTKDNSLNSFTIQITPSSVYLKPSDYNSQPWPVLNVYKPLLRSAGHVKSNDVVISIGYLSEISNYNPNTLSNGSYIWVAFDSASWNVYRFTDLGLYATSVTYNSSNKLLTIKTRDLTTFNVGDYIGITQTANINGFYKITDVNLNSITVSANISNFDPFNDLGTIVVFGLISSKTTSIDNLDTILPTKLKGSELVWTTDDGTGKWATWKYNTVYQQSIFANPLPADGYNYGRSIAISASGDVVATSSADGQTTIYNKPGTLTPWVKKQLIQPPLASANYNSGTHYGSISFLNLSGLNLSLTIQSSGAGYRPLSGSTTYTNVPMAGGTGSELLTDIDVTNGQVTGVRIVSYNNQYQNGETLTAGQLDTNPASPTYGQIIAGAFNVGGIFTLGQAFSVRVVNTCGYGYLPSASIKTYYKVPLQGGNGSGATANIVVKYGKVTSVQLLTSGKNYLPGDSLYANGSDLGGTVSSNFSVSVASVNLNSSDLLATVLSISDDKMWLATSSPTAGYAATTYTGNFITNHAYTANSIVYSSGVYYQTPTALNSSYTGIIGDTQTQGQGARFTIVVIGINFTVNVVSGGAGYKVGNKIKILGSALGGVDSVTDIILTVTSVYESSIVSVTATGICPSKTYTSLPGSIILGAGAQFTISSTISSYTVSITNSGTGYVDGDKILVKGSLIGGKDILNDLTINLNVVLAPYSVTIGAVAGITSWQDISYIPVDLAGSNSSFAAQGLITLYQKDANGTYQTIDSIVSLSQSANENFGSVLKFGNNTLYVGAPGYNSGAGRIYILQYTSTVKASTAYNPIGSSNSTIVVTSTSGIRPGMYIQGTGFTSNQYVLSVVSNTSLLLSGSPNSTPSGILNFVVTGWAYTGTITAPNAVTNFGKSIELGNNMLAVSSAGNVHVYSVSLQSYTLVQTLTGADSKFGNSISISSDGLYLAVSDEVASTSTVNQQGTVVVYSLVNNLYVEYQEIVDHNPEVAGTFGSKVFFTDSGKTLTIYSQQGDTRLTTTFDNSSTTFDKGSTEFFITHVDSGRIDVYNRYNTKWVYSETLSTTNVSNDGYGSGLAVGNNQIFVGAPKAIDSTYVSGQLYNYSKLPNTYTWSISSNQISVPDVSKIKQAFLYNRRTGELVTHLDIIDPLQGKVAGPAEEEIKYKTFYDPAIYTVGTTLVTVDETDSWNTRQIGQLWWNLATAKFINSYDQDVVYRNNNWNKLTPSASIDIYEWISSSLKPSAWDAQADTDAGIAQGISGTSLYGDTVYSTKRTYDKIGKTFKTTYYFWVKNKNIIPDILGRNLSASDVSKLIADPKGQGYTYLALTGLDSFSLANAINYLTSDDIVLSVEYWTIDKTDQNIHSEYKLISNDPSITLPKSIEQKWFDSLCGTDSAGRQVPDPLLPVKLRYGIENRPRQGMFVNRFEALKEFIEYANQVLIQNQVVENNNISSLENYDKEPSLISGLYDTILDTDVELSYANVTNFVTPSLTPVVIGGKITDIIINTAGKGYLIAPYIQIHGSGQGAVVKSIINSVGQLVGATVVSPGEGYNSSTTCSVRSYSILVHSDTQADGVWSIYSYDPASKLWSRTLTQSYDVRKYWSYVDWFSTGYNQFTSADYAVDTISDLNSINTRIGNTVKIRTANQGGWLLLEKYADSSSIDWTASYKVIGVQNGTIQFSNSLYESTGTNIGYDAGIFDTDSYDVVATVELRIILNAIKNQLFINGLKQEYLNLFFSSIHYVFSEQLYVDWIFKTSFVKAQHNIGMLDQPVNYPIDNLANFEDYVNEVKPYRTKVREYVSNYDSLDNAQLPITDFDLQPIYENRKIGLINTTVDNGKIFADDQAINTYPWKFWLDAVGFVVTELVLTSKGSGYVTVPHVVISGSSGTGATGRAFINDGKVTRVILLTSGSGYLSAPTVTLEGGLRSTGTQATAVAIIGNSVIRSTRVQIKFDRYTNKNYITQLQQVETFTGSGSQLQFKLKWSPDVRVGQSSILIDGIPVLRKSYTLSTATSITKGFTSYYGLITFDLDVVPAKGSTIVITYLINESVFNSADRINFYYNPQEGQLGKNLSQLMSGIDYGGVVVDGLGFNVSSGWGSTPYYTGKWDSYDTTYDDYFVTVSANTHSFTLPYVPASGTKINVYHVKNSIDTYTSNGISLEYNYNILAQNPVATTISTVQTSGVQTTYNPAGSYDTILKVANTTGIVAGMGIIGVGFSSNVATLSTTGTSGNGTTATLTFDAQTTPPYKVGQQIVVTNVLPATYTGIFTVTACSNSSVSYASTATGVQTRSGAVKGSSIHTVALVSDSTTVILSKAPDSIPSGTLTFTFNVSGSTQLTVADTSTIHEGDIVACATRNAFTYNASVKSIINSTTVELDSLVYASIDNGINLTFTRTLVQPNDVTINANGTFSLTNAIPSGVVIKITGKIDPVRLDSETYFVDSRDAGTAGNSSGTLYDGGDAASTGSSTIDGGGSQFIVNSTGIMATFIADGTTNTITIPSSYTVVNGDEFILRKSTSDGSILPSATDYDTAITGGDLAYSTATGFAADDILIDGDDFVTPTSSPAPEEVVPGQVVDTVAIKVFDRPSNGSANIKIDNFIGTGSKTSFILSQQPNSSKAIIVKVGGAIKTYSTDYTIDYRNKTVILNTAPANGEIVTVFNIGFNGSNILDLDYFVGDGITYEFVTKAPWVSSVTSLIYIDGQVVSPELFKTDDTYQFINAVGFKFVSPPPAGSLINFIIVNGNQQTFAITNSEQVLTDGVHLTYTLNQQIGTSLPNESNMIVRRGQSILSGPNNSYFVIGKNKLNYVLDPARIAPYSTSIDKINVLAGGIKLQLGKDYTVDLSGIIIKLTRTAYALNSGKQLVVSITNNQGYFYNAATQEITFGQVYDNTQVVEVISSYEHSILDIQRTALSVTSSATITPDTIEFYTYKENLSGSVKLDRPVIDDSYVWVIKNDTLLVPTIDYRLNDDKQSIQLSAQPGINDNITFITFGSNVLTPGIAYQQFKDMLNRTHFKRLSLNKRTTLAQDLHWNDTTLVLIDGTNFDTPNPARNLPGVIEIRGERIEYFAKDGNILSRLRRGTLGTGVTFLNKAGTFVQDIGPTETVPYTESTITEQIISDGTHLVTLGLVPTKSSGTWTYNTGYSSSIPTNYGQADDIEVFVGGYNDGAVWASGVSYNVGDIVNVGSYTYRCSTSHTSGTTFDNNSSNWKFFIGNIRLKKKPYKVHNVNQSPYSPEGDIQLDADFAVDGVSKQLRLTNLLDSGTQVTVIQRIGTAWDSIVNIQNDNSKIAEFLKSTPGVWYTDYKQISNVVEVTTFDNVTTFDSKAMTFDQGI